MGPSRHNTRAAAAGASSAPSSSRNDESSSSASALTSTASRTPTRASPYTRTPTKAASSALSLVGPSTPSRTSSPMMLREIFSMISPFRGHSRAKRSAAFGGVEDVESEDAQDQAAQKDEAMQAPEDVEEDEEDRMIEDAEEGLSAAAEPEPPSSAQRNRYPRAASRSSSPRPAPSAKTLPLADSALVTPGLRRQFSTTQDDVTMSTPQPSSSHAPPPTQTSPVSRNYDLLARFFSEKQRGGGQGGLTEVEVEGCIRLIEESMASGRNLESEFNGSSLGRQYAPMPARAFTASSRASSIAPTASAMPASHSGGNLFHPGTGRNLIASSSAYSFLAPRAPASLSSQMGAAGSTTRRRPIYLGPGMSGLSLNRRRPVVSASRATALSRMQAQGGLPRSSTDPNFMRHLKDGAEDSQPEDARIEETKRRRTALDADAGSSAAFEPNFESQALQSSLLVKDIAASSSPVKAGSPLKRAASSAEPAAPIKTSPPKVPTRTASAIQDILKTTPPVRPANTTKPELVNPYQSAAPLPSKSKEEKEPVRRSARSSMLTRAKARETAKVTEKKSPPKKESVLELIERTAPKPVAKRKAVEGSTQERNGNAPPAAAEPSAEERKVQKTEEVQRRLEALNKAKTQPPPTQEQQKVSKPAASLVPPQYTASKPKKPSPLSAAFKAAPDSPSSDSEVGPVQPQKGNAIAQPNFSFSAAEGNTAKAPTSRFSFSAPKASTDAAEQKGSVAAPSGGFSFSKPASAATAASAAPASGFSFTPAPAPAAQKPATPAPSSGFSFSAPSSSAASTPASSVSDEVIAEDISKLPTFDWQVETAQAPANPADKALRDEIKSVAEAALPEFAFVYEIETAPTKTPAPTMAKPAPSTGFTFSTPTPSPAAPAATPTDESTESSDPTQPTSSGLLGEGEGEESEQTLFTVRAKLWRLDVETKSWKDLGVCITKLKLDSSSNKHRVLARNEANGKVAVNFMVYKGLKTTLDKTVNSFLGFEGTTPTQFRAKCKTEDQAKELKEALEKAAGKS